MHLMFVAIIGFDIGLFVWFPLGVWITYLSIDEGRRALLYDRGEEEE